MWWISQHIVLLRGMISLLARIMQLPIRSSLFLMMQQLIVMVMASLILLLYHLLLVEIKEELRMMEMGMEQQMIHQGISKPISFPVLPVAVLARPAVLPALVVVAAVQSIGVALGAYAIVI